MNGANITDTMDKWARFDAMTEEQRHEAAMSDPDALPMTEEELDNVALTPRVKVLRRALALSQEEFSSRYGIPLDTLRDWEQGRSEPDHTGYAYLRVIAAIPEAVQHALQSAPVS
jgi:putative transcriptional regulator